MALRRHLSCWIQTWVSHLQLPQNPRLIFDSSLSCTYVFCQSSHALLPPRSLSDCSLLSVATPAFTRHRPRSPELPPLPPTGLPPSSLAAYRQPLLALHCPEDLPGVERAALRGNAGALGLGLRLRPGPASMTGSASRILSGHFSPHRTSARGGPPVPDAQPRRPLWGPFPLSPQQGRSAEPGRGSQTDPNPSPACGRPGGRVSLLQNRRWSRPPQEAGAPGGGRRSSPSGFGFCSPDSRSTWQLRPRAGSGSPGIRPLLLTSSPCSGQTDRQTETGLHSCWSVLRSPPHLPRCHMSMKPSYTHTHALTHTHAHTRLCGCRQVLTLGLPVTEGY